MPRKRREKHGHGLGRALASHAQIMPRERKNNPSGERWTNDRSKYVQRFYQYEGSIIDNTVLEGVFEKAELDGKDWNPERDHIELIDTSAEPSVAAAQEILDAMKKKAHVLRLPRRPIWTRQMSAEEIRVREEQAFLRWRRSLAAIERDSRLILTPFEKSLQMWRQLWRTVETGNLIVQIVDARNPLLFWSNDLLRYVAEISYRQTRDPVFKRSVVLLNKADLVPLAAREAWAAYFAAKRLPCVFFSALRELSAREEAPVAPEEAALPLPDSWENICSARVLNAAELTALLTRLAPVSPAPRPNVPPRAVGLIGFPNVGKSSVINALAAKTRVRVGVSATPGKTKHVQSIHLSRELALYDCPGLVLPTFSAVRAEMVVSGVLPPARESDYLSPVALIASRVPTAVFERMYSISVVAEDTEAVRTGFAGGARAAPRREGFSQAREVLSALSLSRGFMASHGVPDLSRSARIILQDYIDGRLLWVALPPRLDPSPAPAAPAEPAAPPTAVPAE
eukprot:gnl/Chilomastix_cuspidata/739.p1 GENE.gnl/Chilomastix_cuspidata/739~~gnl/Chilomastix_cuspidata/739.p1  ORF type:complete len:511 (-),score=188.15 gnl/Chilomastix_cuspidata/739:19-1551(-)